MIVEPDLYEPVAKLSNVVDVQHTFPIMVKALNHDSDIAGMHSDSVKYSMDEDAFKALLAVSPSLPLQFEIDGQLSILPRASPSAALQLTLAPNGHAVGLSVVPAEHLSFVTVPLTPTLTPAVSRSAGSATPSTKEQTERPVKVQKSSPVQEEEAEEKEEKEEPKEKTFFQKWGMYIAIGFYLVVKTVMSSGEEEKKKEGEQQQQGPPQKKKQ